MSTLKFVLMSTCKENIKEICVVRVTLHYGFQIIKSVTINFIGQAYILVVRRKESSMLTVESSQRNYLLTVEEDETTENHMYCCLPYT